jgi:hypothetical protein
LGAAQVAVLGIDLAMAGSAFASAHAPASAGQLYSIGELLAYPRWWRVALDVLLLGTAGGLYVVPLSALIQSRSADRSRAQVIAAGNVINALFMIAASVVGIVGLGVVQLSIPELFVVVVGMHLLMMLLLFTRVAEFRQRFSARFLVRA